MIAAIVGSLIVWLATSSTAALLTGGIIRYRNRQVPS